MNCQHVLLLLVGLLFGCASSKLPTTLGDVKKSPTYGYTPIDPLPVEVLSPQAVTTVNSSKILDALPDETVRLAIGQFDSEGGLTFGPAKIGVKGGSYVVVLDYIKFDTKSFGVEVKTTPNETNPYQRSASVTYKPNPDLLVPVYIGVGLRLTANITVNEGSVDLGNLLALGVSAQAKQISGTLVIQTLGISGEGISGSIPLPSEINQTSVQNAIQSLGAIRAVLYAEKTRIRPRVVGVYNNLGGGQQTVNSFITSLLENPIPLKIE
ncbi:hypothetical protein DYU11_19760 [Fibrisoma montanum]|uniref:Uncharacterized protein n=1 Tax=Fibrisoma montanum TaxID=2305895 RepID=A0A418M6Z7_9BACT|nr:hypothetical protein [Fibrisoma montanum]RIV21634.1 hypothetical protein DYU11_19760 [Fibrisoma montanum]